VKLLAAEKVKGQTMCLLCRLFGKSWQAYYQHQDTLGKQRLTEEIVVQFVKEIRQLDPGMGGEKLQLMYLARFGRDYEYMVGRDKMEAIIARNGLNVRIPRHRPRTTDSTHGLPTYPNLVRELIPTRKNQLWVTDITYIPIWNADGSYTFCYLSMITDYYTKEIIAWYVGETMEAWCSVECLMQALGTLPADEVIDLIHHSDRGVQYVSAAYTSLLIEAGIKISMTESGDPKDNAVAERQNNTVKNELLKDIKFHSIGEVRRAMTKAVEFYNNERPHMSLNNMTPRQAASCMGKIQKKWISYREKYLENLEIQEGACTFAPQTLNMIEQLSAEPIQEKQGLRENHSTLARVKSNHST
jgi:transposase InsO family protein